MVSARGRDTVIAQKNLKFSKPTDMTIHWKGLEEHFLMVPFFIHNFFWENAHFLSFSKTPFGVIFEFRAVNFIVTSVLDKTAVLSL
jgi:hypothetical protein